MPSPDQPFQPGTMSLDGFLERVDARPYLEYIDGGIIERSEYDRQQARLVGEISFALSMHVAAHGGDSATQPHINLSGGERAIYRLIDAGYWAPGNTDTDGEGISYVPTIAVEVRSGDYTLDEQREKCRSLAANGAGVCWLVLPETRTVEVFERGAERVLDENATLESSHAPGFSLPLASLFALLD